jgi:uncharacterized repeat protein (TIGR01451 family)
MRNALDNSQGCGRGRCSLRPSSVRLAPRFLPTSKGRGKRPFRRAVALSLLVALLMQMWPVSYPALVQPVQDVFDRVLPAWVTAAPGHGTPWEGLGPHPAQAQGPDLQISKSAPATVDQGDMLRYTLRITNTMIVPATKVVVSDTIPSLGAYTLYAPPDDGSAGIDTGSGGDWYVAHPGGSDFIQWGTMDAINPVYFSGLPSGDTAELYFEVRVREPVPDQTAIVNSDYSADAENAGLVSGQATTTYVNAPHWAISKEVSSSSIQPGEYLTYTITASNDGHLTASGRYTISDVIPQYTDYISSTLTVSKTGDLLTWTFDEILAVGASHVVTYVVQVTDPLTDGLSIVNDTYSVTGSNVYTGAVGAPVSSSVRAPALEIAKTDHVDFIRPGDILTYTLSYSNSGGAAATGVVISDGLDANTSFVASDPAADLCVGSVCYWNFDTLPAAGFGSIVVTVSVTSPLESGTLLTNMASMTSAEGYSDQALETTLVLGTPVLHLVKEANTSTVEPGQLITYTLSYSNSGDSPALGVFITDTIDANTIFQSASPGYSDSYVWDIGTLWPSATHQLTLTVRVADSLTEDTTLTNQAIISARGNISDTDQALVSVETTPILHVVKEANTDRIQPGDSLTYTLWYSNTGNGRAHGVLITDTLPTQLHFKDADPAPTTADDQQPIWTLADVPVGGPYSITLVVTSDGTIGDLTPLTNQVALSSVETATLTATNTVTVTAVELAVTKTVSPILVKANEYITYTVTVMNQGHAPAGQVTITDTLPAAIVASSVFSSASPGVVPDGGATSPPTYVWTTPALAGQSSITLSISGRLITSPWSADGDAFTNTVQVGSNDNEANSANNSDRVQATGRPGDSADINLIAVPVETTVGNTILVTATVTDAWGNPAYTGETVAFDTSLSTMIPGSRMTQDGIAASSLSSVQPGVAVITGTTVSNGLETTTSVTFTTGALDHFVFSPIIPTPQTAGVPFSITIRAEDAYNNLIPTYATSISLQDSTGTLSPVSTGSDWTGGVWTGSATITGTRHADAITASDGPIQNSSNLFDVRPGPPDSVALQVTSPMPPCGATSVHTATVRDSYSNLLWAGTPITFYLTSLGGVATLVPSYPYVGQTDDSGVVKATVQSSQLGPVRLQVDIDGDHVFDDEADILISGVGPATDMQIKAVPPTIAVGATSLVTVTLHDCLDQPVPDETVDLALSGLGSLSPASGSTTASGDFTSMFSAGLTPGTAFVTALSGPLSASTPITITGGPVFAVTKTAQPEPGTTIPVTQTITYLVVVTNSGTTASNFELTDAIPSNSQYVPGSASASAWASLSQGDPLRVTATTFGGSGQVLTFTFTVSPTGGGDISNQVSISSDQTSSQTSNVVDHPVTTSGGTKSVFLPIILNNWGGEQPGPTNANLVVESIDFVGSPPINDGDRYHVQVTVRNIGSEAVTNDFWVDLYLNPVSTPTVNQPWQYLSQSGEQGVSNCPSDATCYGRAWYVSTDLAPGQVAVLSTQMASDQRWDRWPAEGVPYVGGRHNPIVALVDSFSAGQWYGAVYENDETDNLSATISGAGAVPSASGAALPAVPSWPAGSPRPSLPAADE